MDINAGSSDPRVSSIEEARPRYSIISVFFPLQHTSMLPDPTIAQDIQLSSTSIELDGTQNIVISMHVDHTAQDMSSVVF